ncbi:hypothetical protein [Jongsikchunia kroppenstedtii]|uniref:hypothetical protein n=1 Tax=Jongsikchunia kroppenstedtii TaxID=1121721 RepID=UPI00037EE964|nr:hypothetical protein [Jongsikchunia kroppenstedtii]
MRPDYAAMESAADLGLGYPPDDDTDDLVGANKTTPEVAASEAVLSNPTHQMTEGRTMTTVPTPADLITVRTGVSTNVSGKKIFADAYLLPGAGEGAFVQICHESQMADGELHETGDDPMRPDQADRLAAALSRAAAAARSLDHDEAHPGEQNRAGQAHRLPHDLADFAAALSYVPELPEEAGEYVENVDSTWIADVIAPGSDDTPSPHMHVGVERFGNNQPEFDAPVLTYEISVVFGRQGEALHLTPEAAIEMGRHLLEAAAWATRDRARHTDWMLRSGGESE